MVSKMATKSMSKLSNTLLNRLGLEVAVVEDAALVVELTTVPVSDFELVEAGAGCRAAAGFSGGALWRRRMTKLATAPEAIMSTKRGTRLMKSKPFFKPSA